MNKPPANCSMFSGRGSDESHSEWSPQDPGRAPASHSPRHAPGARPVPCPYCGATSGVRQTGDTGRIQAWSCDHCDTDWAFTVPDSRTAALLGDLGAAAQEIRRLRWTLAQVVALADAAPTITNEQLRDRLLALAARWWALSPLDRLEHAGRDSTVIAALRAVLLRHQPPATGAAKAPEQTVEIAEGAHRGSSGPFTPEADSHR
jgi:hypothetical protein